MYRLSRTVRCTISPGLGGDGVNGFGGRPAMAGIGRYYEIEVRCSGEPDAVTGYLINIKDMDRAVRSAVIPLIARAVDEDPAAHPASLMPALLGAARSSLPVTVESVVWHLTPYMSLEAGELGRVAGREEDAMGSSVVVRQRFEFSASHRLHVAELGDDENVKIFGKCNNPAGHGHNYRVEPAIEMDAASPVPVGEIESLVDELVIERFDHKHLNTQTEEFGEAGVNPSVENIAKVCFEILREPVGRAGGRLRAVTVWETDRTSCTYPVGN